MESLLWFTRFENTKPLSLVIFFTVFCGILLYLYGSRSRGQRLEEYKNIPLQDEEKKEAQS
ncbi:Cbb3-type cytochrome oxidase component FixQ [mine drainage metagenome]|jgi:cbb3-type cytochrome oxidase subunit 3|uniref:Cbb3-type cytochrome oxidase component FixQ n=1 Tax=mine drainage metagenome TaxID=410659 RepID=A0A1J5R3B9_9ZZZZ